MREQNRYMLKYNSQSVHSSQIYNLNIVLAEFAVLNINDFFQVKANTKSTPMPWLFTFNINMSWTETLII